MHENLETEIFELAKNLQLLSFATVTEDGRPRVRYVVGKADPTLALRFSTHLDSAKVSQLRNNPNAFVTLGASDVRATTWLEIEGSAEISVTEAERHNFWFPGLAAHFSGMDDPNYCVVIVRPGKIALHHVNEPQAKVWRTADAASALPD